MIYFNVYIEEYIRANLVCKNLASKKFYNFKSFSLVW